MTAHKRRVNYRLYPTAKQQEVLLGLLRKHQLMYNAALEQRITAYKKSGVSLTYQDQAKDLTELRAALPEFKAVNAQSSQNTLKRLDRAMKAFFRRIKSGKTPGFPRFKSFARYSGWGYNTHGDGWRLHSEKKHGYIRISGVGFIRMRGKARTQGNPKTLNIMYKQGKWYASVVFDCQPEREQDKITGAMGLDWGVETFATLAHDSGEYTAIHNERHLRNELAKLKRLQRDLSRKKRGSRNWEKLKKQLAVLHGKIARKRHEFLHQTSAKLVKENSLIAVEKLNVKGMTASGGSYKKGLNREVLSTAPAAFHKMLKYKVEETGTRYIEVPTHKVKPSQTCSGCGKRKKKTLQQRRHNCPCGAQLSRDENAARAILNWAMGRESAQCGGKPLGQPAKHETPAIVLA